MHETNVLRKALVFLLLIAAVVASESMVSVARADIISFTNANQVRDNDADNLGESLGNPDFLLAGYFANTNVENIHTVWAFPMTGFSSGSQIGNADFSASVFSSSGTPDFNLDLHVIRIAATDALAVSDYEDSEQLIMEDFWTSADGTGGPFSLDATGQAALTSYLQNNWVENDYIFLGVKTDPLLVDTYNSAADPGVQRFINFGDGDLSDTGTGTFSDAQLSVSPVPEPSSLALLSLGGLAVLCRKYRRRDRNTA